MRPSRTASYRSPRGRRPHRIATLEGATYELHDHSGGRTIGALARLYAAVRESQGPKRPGVARRNRPRRRCLHREHRADATCARAGTLSVSDADLRAASAKLAGTFSGTSATVSATASVPRGIK